LFSDIFLHFSCPEINDYPGKKAGVNGNEGNINNEIAILSNPIIRGSFHVMKTLFGKGKF
jgi:hypothetical protein